MSRVRISHAASIAVVVVASVALAPRAARADASPADRAAAQTLFDDGMKLLGAHHYAEACPKLQESQRLDPSVGTAFNLADCYEHVGKTATAWTLFLDVAAQTHTVGQLDREQAARDRAKALEPTLSRLEITVAAPDTPGLVVERDGGAVGRPLWGTPAPIDAGDHVVRATAPGKKPWQGQVHVDPGGKVASLAIPALADGPSGPVEGSDTSSGGWSTRRWIGVAVTGAGLVGIGVGSALGLVANSKNNDAHTPENCRDATHCYTSGADLVASAKSLATGSTVAFIAGGVAVAGGVTIFLTAPNARPASTGRIELKTWAAPGSAGATVGGAF